jgi:hypothetical protein
MRHRSLALSGSVLLAGSSKKKHFKTQCIQIQTSSLALKQTRKRLFKSLLTRIDRMNFSKLVIYAG